VHTFLRDGWRIASRYDEHTKIRAVRLIREHAGDYETEWAALKVISARLRMSVPRR
jgi:transposase